MEHLSRSAMFPTCGWRRPGVMDRFCSPSFRAGFFAFRPAADRRCSSTRTIEHTARSERPGPGSCLTANGISTFPVAAMVSATSCSPASVSRRARSCRRSRPRSTLDSGYLVFARDGTLLGQPFDAFTGRTTGDPFPVAEPVPLLLFHRRRDVCGLTQRRAGLSVTPRAGQAGVVRSIGQGTRRHQRFTVARTRETLGRRATHPVRSRDPQSGRST